MRCRGVVAPEERLAEHVAVRRRVEHRLLAEAEVVGVVGLRGVDCVRLGQVDRLGGRDQGEAAVRRREVLAREPGGAGGVGEVGEGGGAGRRTVHDFHRVLAADEGHGVRRAWAGMRHGYGRWASLATAWRVTTSCGDAAILPGEATRCHPSRFAAIQNYMQRKDEHDEPSCKLRNTGDKTKGRADLRAVNELSKGKRIHTSHRGPRRAHRPPTAEWESL